MVINFSLFLYSTGKLKVYNVFIGLLLRINSEKIICYCKFGTVDISRGTDRRKGPTLCWVKRAHKHDPFTKTSKTLAVMQGLRPLFLRLASQQGKT